LLANLIIGLFVLQGYGESVDEISQRNYAERTIQAVKGLLTTGTTPAYFTQEAAQQGSHGPAFMMVVLLLRKLFVPDGTAMQDLCYCHYLYFIMFQVGVISIYFLALRWMGKTAAFGTALLFSTQPILVGHAFMNPKDVVFMSLFIASAALGFWIMDRREKSIQIAGGTEVNPVRSFLAQFLCADVWLAGMLLGFTSAIRVAAPLVGLVIFAYIVFSQKWYLLPRFFAYGLIAFGFMILLWPYLWPDPLGRLMESILYSAQYPDIHLTLFKGVLYNSTDLPRSYLPVLLAVQLTETTLLFIVLGAFAFARKLRWDLVALILIWFVLPAAAVIFKQVSLYNNFRQVFFILPPLFLLAGMGLDFLFHIFRQPVAHYVIIFLMVLPGLYANLMLYPYQYVYYNQLAGGLPGAYRVFEMDYWNLAFKESQTYINQNAGANADVFVADSKQCAMTFARTDLDFNDMGCQKVNWDKYDYMIVSTAGNSDKKFAGFPTVFTVQRFGVPLAYVKKP
jgi:hypothetical protein